jgi:hypothetical protein
MRAFGLRSLAREAQEGQALSGETSPSKITVQKLVHNRIYTALDYPSTTQKRAKNRRQTTKSNQSPLDISKPQATYNGELHPSRGEFSYFWRLLCLFRPLSPKPPPQQQLLEAWNPAS